MLPDEVKKAMAKGGPCPAVVKMVQDKCQLTVSSSEASTYVSNAIQTALLRGRRARKSMLRHLSAPAGAEDLHALSLRRSLMISEHGYDENGPTRALSIQGFTHKRSLSEEAASYKQRRLSGGSSSQVDGTTLDLEESESARRLP